MTEELTAKDAREKAEEVAWKAIVSRIRMNSNKGMLWADFSSLTEKEMTKLQDLGYRVEVKTRQEYYDVSYYDSEAKDVAYYIVSW